MEHPVNTDVDADVVLPGCADTCSPSWQACILSIGGQFRRRRTTVIRSNLQVSVISTRWSFCAVQLEALTKKLLQ